MNFEMDDMDGVIFDLEIEPLTNRRMIVVKVLEGGDIHAEDNLGQMVIVRSDGSVTTFLDGDDQWVHGHATPNKDGSYWEGSAWEIIGFHLGMTYGSNMERTRNGTVN